MSCVKAVGRDLQVRGIGGGNGYKLCIIVRMDRCTP